MNGLLRFARNDGGMTSLLWIASPSARNDEDVVSRNDEDLAARNDEAIVTAGSENEIAQAYSIIKR